MVSISRIFETDIEMSYPVEIFLDTEHNFLPNITKFGAPRYSVCTYIIRRKTFLFSFFVQHISLILQNH